MIYLFYGEDDLARDEYLAGLLERVDDPMADLNRTRLDGDRVDWAELRHACDAVPFLGERRIVIVEGLVARLVKRGPRDFTDALRDYIGHTPEYTRLFLLEQGVDRRSALWKALDRASKEEPPRAFVREFALPDERSLPAWIVNRARHHGGRIEREAASDLATFVGRDVRLLDQEIRKLVTYAGDRPVGPRDIRELVPYVEEATIWELVDAIGARDARTALATAQRLLADDPGKAIYLHIMITRQIRMLLQVAELQRLGEGQAEMQRRLRMSPFVLRRVIQQAQNFTVEWLERAFDRLLDADVAMKSGADQLMTLNLLIIELAGRRAA